VTAYATERGQEQAVDIGGVALKARFEGKKAESWVWWLIVIFILIALLIAFYAFRKK
jgi:hypothetical protein